MPHLPGTTGGRAGVWGGGFGLCGRDAWRRRSQAGWEAASVLTPCLLPAATREAGRGGAGRLRAMTSAVGKAKTVCAVARRARP